MATYKVIQDVEAEDKLIGFLTFRQFLYLMVAALSLFLAYGLYQLTPFLAALPLPFAALFGLLGLWRREDQPIETYLLAFLNFAIKPRKRIWNPNGVIHNVIIAVPKPKPVPMPPSPDETRGQLKGLAQIIDTRGWSSKRPELQEPLGSHRINADDRIALPNQTFFEEPIDIHENDDMFATSAIAEKMSELAAQSTQQTRVEAIAKMKTALSAPTKPSPPPQPYVNAAPPAKPLAPEATSTQKAATDAPTKGTASVSKHNRPDAILGLAHSELKIDHIAVKANQGSNKISEGEEVSLR